MTTITEDYCDFETAKLLKEKGFPQQRMEFAVATRDCSLIVNGSQKVKERAGTKFPYYPYSKLFSYEEDWAVLPTLQMAMKWLRKVYNIIIIIDTNDIYNENRFYFCRIYWARGNRTEIKWKISNIDKKYEYFTTYEQACEAAINYCLKNLI